MKLYAIGMLDGGVAMMRCAEGVLPADEIAKWPAEMQGQVQQVVEVDEAQLPDGNRDKWVLMDGAVTVG